MKYLDMNEARELGVVFEVNRQMLHPRGLALEVHTTENPPIFLLPIDQDTLDAWRQLIKWARPRMPEWGEALDRMDKRLAEGAESRPAVLRVQDHRDDPEGVFFGDISGVDRANARRFHDLVRPERLRRLGYVVEPL
jgi:hypothetical protein